MPEKSPHTESFETRGVTRHAQLTALFRRRIQSGAWPVGSQIPTVNDLAGEFQVARATIRQALDKLEDEGLISRFRARGTFVNKHGNDRLWCDVKVDWNGLLHGKDGAEIEVLFDSTGPMTFTPPHSIGVRGNEYRQLKRRHKIEGQAYLVTDLFIDAEFARKIPENAIRNWTALRLASSIPGIKVGDARQTMTIGTAEMETAKLLSIPLNSPICFVDRSIADKEGRLIVLSRGIYRGDMVRTDIWLSTADS